MQTCLKLVYVVQHVHLCVWQQHFIVSVGCYLGYPQKEKYKVWIDNLSQQRLEEAEKSATDYISLGKLLMQIIFSKELEEAERWCCTKSKGRKILDQDKLRGIRGK